MSPTSYQTAPPRTSIINNAFNIVKLAAPLHFPSTFARAAGRAGFEPLRRGFVCITHSFDLSEFVARTACRIQCRVLGIEQTSRFQELGI